MPFTGFWSAVLQSDQRLTVTPGGRLRLSNVATHHALHNRNVRSTLIVKYCPEGTTTVVSATIGSIVESYVGKPMTCDIVLQKGVPYTFESFGGNTLHLSGHFFEQDERIEETKIVHEGKHVGAFTSSEHKNTSSTSDPASSSKPNKSALSKHKVEKIPQASMSSKGKRKERDESDDESTGTESTCTDDDSDSDSDSSAQAPRSKKPRTR